MGYEKKKTGLTLTHPHTFRRKEKLVNFHLLPCYNPIGSRSTSPNSDNPAYEVKKEVVSFTSVTKIFFCDRDIDDLDSGSTGIADNVTHSEGNYKLEANFELISEFSD